MGGERAQEAIPCSMERQVLALEASHAALGEAMGLSRTELFAVRRILHRNGITPSELRSGLRLSSGGTTALVQRLEEHGWVRRSPHATDRRSVMLRLTSHGGQRLTAATAAVDAAIDAVTNGLSPLERTALRRWLDGVARAVERHTEETHVARGRTPSTARRLPPPSLWS